MQQDEVTQEGQRLLTLAPSVLRKLDPRTCRESAYVLEQFGFRIQQALNRESARLAWAQASVEKAVVHKLDSVGGYKYEERLLRAIASDEAAQALENIRINAALRLEKLAFLANRIASMSKILAQLGDK